MLLFVSAHWDGLSPQARFALVVGLVSGFHIAAAAAGGRFPGMATTLHAVGTVSLGAGIFLAGQIFNAAPHMLEINWVPLVGSIVITHKTWDAFPAAQQEALSRAAKEATSQLETDSRQESENSVVAMKKRGLILHKATPEIDAEWRKAAEEAYPRIRGGMVPADMFDEVRRLLQEFRAGAKS